MSNLNSVTLNGRIPNFEATYKQGEGDKKSFYSGSISVRRNFKGKDDKFYPEDLIRIKAFGANADFIYNNFKAGDGIIVVGRLQKDEDYTDTNGESKKGQLYVLVNDKYFADGKKMNGTADKGSNESAPAASRPAGRPGASRPGAPGRPGAPKRPGAR